MDADKELAAIAEITASLAGLSDDETRQRVIRYFAERYKAEIRPPGSLGVQQRQSVGESSELSLFEDLAAFFSAASPRTEYEKVLVVGVWQQLREGKADLNGFEVNSALKHLGHGVSNVTSCFNELMSRKPQLAHQTQKTGKSKQGRKKYRITIEGQRVAMALSNKSADEREG